MAIKQKLSHRFIDGIKPAAQQRVEYADSEAPGLYLLVHRGGTKTFSCVFYQRNGRTVRAKLGRYPHWSLEAARREARRLAGEIAAGVDVAARQHTERTLLTLGELFNLYEADRIAAGKRSTLNMRQTFERWVGRIPDEPPKKHARKRVKPQGSVDWSARRIDAVSQHDLAILLERVKAGGLGTTANRIAEVVSAMYRFARRRKLYDGDNPAEGIEPVQERERTRFLQSTELPRFLTALKQLEPMWQDFFALLLALGYRRRAVAAMRWEHLDLEAGVWNVPVGLTKNGEALVLPVVGEALQISGAARSTAKPPTCSPAALLPAT